MNLRERSHSLALSVWRENKKNESSYDGTAPIYGCKLIQLLLKVNTFYERSFLPCETHSHTHVVAATARALQFTLHRAHFLMRFCRFILVNKYDSVSVAKLAANMHTHTKWYNLWNLLNLNGYKGVLSRFQNKPVLTVCTTPSRYYCTIAFECECVCIP